MSNIFNFLENPENIDFKFLSKNIIKFNLIEGCSYHPNLPLIRVYDQLFNDKNHNINIEFGAGAQFIVSKKKILSNPISMYKNIIDILSYDKNPIEGFVIERFHCWKSK